MRIKQNALGHIISDVYAGCVRQCIKTSASSDIENIRFLNKRNSESDYWGEEYSLSANAASQTKNMRQIYGD